MPSSKRSVLAKVLALIALLLVSPQQAWSQATQPMANQPARVATPPLPGFRQETSTPALNSKHISSQDAAAEVTVRDDPFVSTLSQHAEALVQRPESSAIMQTALLLGAVGLAPAVLLLTTCYLRIFIVISLLRQGIGAQHLPPTQILMALSLCITIMVMAPVWKTMKEQVVDPLRRAESETRWHDAWQRGASEVKRFMLRQIEITGNIQAIDVFYRHGAAGASPSRPHELDQVPLNVVLPAFILSELKVAFLLGFQVLLPFLVLDLVVATVTVSLGMVMLPPALVSLPLKLILFVMVDGWNLVVGMLLQSLSLPV